MYICGWLGAVHYCFALQSCSLNEPFERLDTFSILEIVNESDENKSFSPKTPSCANQSVDIAISGLGISASDLGKNEN